MCKWRDRSWGIVDGVPARTCSRRGSWRYGTAQLPSHAHGLYQRAEKMSVCDAVLLQVVFMESG
eukprot:5578954-Amphidinium_carterae.1